MEVLRLRQQFLLVFEVGLSLFHECGHPFFPVVLVGERIKLSWMSHILVGQAQALHTHRWEDREDSGNPGMVQIP